MSFDNSRFTFNPRNDYSGVVMQQGRVQLDSDWNEWLAEFTRRIQAGTLDILGRAVYPATTPYAFQITASPSAAGNVLLIGPGRIYVDGLLAENHGDPAAAKWDPALAEMSDTPQPLLASATTGAIDYTQQPYMPPNTKLPAGTGPFLAYLDVWVRPVNYLNDPNLIDKAVGVDSTGRLQTVWQVRLLDLSNSPGATCDSDISGWPPAPSAGLLSTGTTPTAPSGPCCLTSGAAYTGMENQFYRVEIHQPGSPEASAVPSTVAAPTGATFKWSRDNGSVISGVTSISSATNAAGNPASQLAVQSLGRDQVLGFAPGNWIEILDDSLEFGQAQGELHQIDTIDFSARTITLATTLGPGFATGDTNPNLHTRIRRWDQSGKVYEQDGTTVWWDIDAQGMADIPLPPAGTALILESGITVSFDLSSAAGSFVTGDFWTFAARTADGSVEKLDRAAPRGLHHHYTRLSIVTFPSSATDCRTEWPPASQSECGCCCTYVVGQGLTGAGRYSSINDAIKALPDAGGEICILPGRYFENVLIENCRDVVLRGCGWQTRIASLSLEPSASPAAGGPAPTNAGAPAPAPAPAGGSGLNAVITVSASQHVQLLSFAVEAAKDEVGILLDGTGTLSAGQSSGTGATNVPRALIIERRRVTDVTIEDLIVTASTEPAILASFVTLLQIEGNRIAMENVSTRWPAVWVSGSEIRIVHNWLGIQGAAVDGEWLPATVTGDFAADAKTGAAAGLTGAVGIVPLHPGGIQLAGPSRDVLVADNEIDSAGRNGITLGGVSILDANGKDTGEINGVTIEVPGHCDTTVTLTIPGSKSGQPGSRIVAAGNLVNIQIDRNRIRQTGLCGIGPVGFFTLSPQAEVISIQNLTISSNTVTRALLGELAALGDAAGSGYAAICVPDVENLVVRDNTITDFGLNPGDPVCGIFVLHGQMVDVSRNQVIETRDWNSATHDQVSTTGSVTGGIVVLNATPPTLSNLASVYTMVTSITADNAAPAFVPGVPALRVEHNVVRVASGDALEAYGFGPFSIVNNHLSTAGTTRGGVTTLAQTVLILNLGISIELASLAGKFAKLGHYQTVRASPFLGRGPGTTSNGAVTFTNNICQLGARISRPHCFSSVTIMSLDDLIFSNNQCWVDALPLTSVLDVCLLAASLQVTGNRFQESAAFPVLASGFTVGGLNITSQNISTYCLFATGTLQPALDTHNLSLIGSQLCDGFARNVLKLNFSN